MSRSTTSTFPGPRGGTMEARLEQPDGDTHATALLAHGLPADSTAARLLATALTGRGMAVLSMGVGPLATGEDAVDASTFAAAVDDLVVAAGHLAEVVAPPALLVGHSLGGAAVLAAATRIGGIEAIATIGAPADTRTAETLDDDDLDAALLILHAPLDNVVGISAARTLFQATRHPKSFVSLAGSDHLLSDDADARFAADVIAAWATRYVSTVPQPTDDRAQAPAAALGRSHGSYADAPAVASAVGTMQVDVDTRGFRLRADEPSSRGGSETGPTPYDYLAAGLAACTSMTVRMYADRKELPLEAVTTTVTFDRVHADDCEHCDDEDRRIELFSRDVAFEGDLDDQQRERLLEIANRCPVHRTLEGTIEVRTTMAEP